MCLIMPNLSIMKVYRPGSTPNPFVAPYNFLTAQQSFFNPYPSELLDIGSIIEACGDRDYWKNMN